MSAFPREDTRRALRAHLLGRAFSAESVVIGLAGTLLVHLLLAFVAPGLLLHTASWMTAVPVRSTAFEAPSRFEFVLVPAEESPVPQRYFEVNPDAPVEEPDRADRFSFQDQRAASPDPVLGSRDEPLVEGVEQPTARLLAGDPAFRPAEPVTQPDPPAPIVRPRPELAPAGLRTRPDESSGADEARGVFERIEPEPAVDADGIRFPEQRRPVPGTTPPLIPPWAAEQMPTQPELPRRDAPPQARPVLRNVVLPGQVEKLAGGTRRMGLVAVNARFNEYGEYLRRMFEAIQVQWYRLIEGKIDALVFPSHVDVRFVIDREGRVLEVEVLRTNAGLIGTLIARDAIEARSPYGPFSEDMRRNLGQTEEILVRFNYL